MNFFYKKTDGNGNWITAGETKPEFDEESQTLIMREAKWDTNGGRAEITPIEVYNSDTLACVLIGYRYAGRKYNGIYAMKSRKSPILNKYAGYNRVLVRLALSGTVIEANEGMRAHRAQIVEVLS